MIYIEKSNVPIAAFQLQLANWDFATLVKASADQLTQTDKLISCDVSTDCQLTLSGKGEVHLEAVVKQLQASHQFPIEIIDRFVRYRECITDPDRQIARTISSNKLNILAGTAEVIHPHLLTDIEDNVLQNMSEPERTQYLQREYQWSIADSPRIWSSMSDNHINYLINATTNVPHMDTIREQCTQGFIEACAEGVLAGEPIRGVKLNLIEATVPALPRMRSSGQITQVISNLIKGIMLISKPQLAQPIYELKLSPLANQHKSILIDILKRRRAIIEDSTLQANEMLAYLPVAKSFGLAAELGKFGWQNLKVDLALTGWDLLTDSPSECKQLIETIRKRKGLKRKPLQH